MNDLVFLPEATSERLQEATAANTTAWIAQLAEVGGGEVRIEPGVTWIYAPGSVGNEAKIHFPRLADADLGPRLDEFLAECRQRDLQQVSCWSLNPPQPFDLGARLVARGFEWGWQPHWMWLDLQRLQTEHPHPPDLRVEIIDQEPGQAITDLPYYYQGLADDLEKVAKIEPRRYWHFGAWLGDQLVGHSILYLTTGPLGVGGIYNCGVRPEARNRGVGKAVTLAACQQAAMLGCPHVVLNATPLGEPVYRRLGFESIGYGQTWWLHRPVLEALPPTSEQINLVEAVGRGDLAALTELASQHAPEEMDRPLPAGLTLIQLAVKMQQPAAVQWLVDHGATLDILSARDLGWRERIPGLLKAHPELANRPVDANGATALHIAALENDIELVKMLLEGGADPTIEDHYFHSTPLGWAKYNHSLAAVELIEAHQKE